jgi:hypothetical protein
MSRIVINVSKNGQQLFSTSRASLPASDDSKVAVNDSKAMEVAAGLRAGFPESDGYTVEVFYICRPAGHATQLVKSGESFVMAE